MSKAFAIKLRQSAPLLFVLGCYWLLLIYNLGAQWSVYEQYRYGWSVPFLCAWLVWRRIESPESKVLSPESKVLSPEAKVLSPEAKVLSPHSAYFYLLIGVLAVLYAPTRFLHEANPIWRLTSLLWAIEVIGLTLLVVQVVLQANEHYPIALRHSLFRGMLFPICFFLVAVPWPTSLEAHLVQWLTGMNVRGTIELLGLAGFPAIRHGNVIEVGTGEIGVNEACSGIRSFQATLMISLFLGELYRLKIWRRAALCVTGVALAFVFNMGRTFLLAGVGSAKGVTSIAAWHDPAGTAILVACFIGLWLAALAFRGSKPNVLSSGPIVLSPATTGGSSDFDPRPSSYGTIPGLAWSLLAWLLLVEIGTELWYRSHERIDHAPARWTVELPVGDARFMTNGIPESVRDQFRYDAGFEAEWRNSSGAAWQLYYFRWQPTRSLNNRVAVQIAKSHGPEMCLPAIGMALESDLGETSIRVGDFSLATHQFIFNTQGRPLHVFYGIYEDQTGSGQLVNRRQTSCERVEAALAGSRNYGQRFLEVAVTGFDKPEEAKAAFASELSRLITIGQRSR